LYWENTIRIDYTVRSSLYLEVKVHEISQSSISMKTYQSLQCYRLLRTILVSAYILCCLYITRSQLQKLKQSSTESTDRKKYVDLTLEISVNYQTGNLQSIYQFLNMERYAKTLTHLLYSYVVIHISWGWFLGLVLS